MQQHQRTCRSQVAFIPSLGIDKPSLSNELVKPYNLAVRLCT
jgi:hypothetical protein